MAAMLRNSPGSDIEEMGTVFALAMAKLAGEPAMAAAAPEERPPRRRELTAAEWRRERRALRAAS